MDNSSCWNCNKNYSNFICGQCKMAVYCNKICQKNNWKNNHNKNCLLIEVKRTREEEEEKEEEGSRFIKRRKVMRTLVTTTSKDSLKEIPIDLLDKIFSKIPLFDLCKRYILLFFF
jgi:hypothetical protein